MGGTRTTKRGIGGPHLLVGSKEILGLWDLDHRQRVGSLGILGQICSMILLTAKTKQKACMVRTLRITTVKRISIIIWTTMVMKVVMVQLESRERDVGRNRATAPRRMSGSIIMSKLVLLVLLVLLQVGVVVHGLPALRGRPFL